MPSFMYDLRYLQAGIPVLQDFLLSKDLYWAIGAQPPPGEPPYPQLTLGGIALALMRAEGHATTATQKQQVDGVAGQIKPIFQQWRSAWGNKAAEEIRSRITQWGNFLSDYWENADRNADRYSYEVFRRVIIALLLPEAIGLTDEEKNALDGLDQNVKNSFVPGTFIWDKELEAVFPKEQFWFLYGKLSKK